MAHNLPEIQQKALTLKNYLHQPKIKKAIEDSLPKWLSVDRFLRVIFTATMKNPKIIECTPESILQSVISCSQLGLEPILGRAYLIPYKNSKLIGNRWEKVLECQFQPGYQGLIDLARRTNTIRDVYALNVFENDDFDLTFGTDRKIHHRPWYLNKDNKEPGEIIGVYAVWEMKDGTKHPEFMPISDVYKRRDKSQAYKYAMDNPNNKGAQDCPWITWPEEMIIKTVIKHSSKLVPASIDFMQAVALDEAADLGRSQIGMFSDTPDYNGLLPESSGAIDVTPSKRDTAEKEENEGPKTDPNFAAMVKKESGEDFEYVPTKDGKAHSLLSAYIEMATDHNKMRNPDLTPYDIMKSVSSEGTFPGFWNGFKAGTWQHNFNGVLPSVESEQTKPKPVDLDKTDLTDKQREATDRTFSGNRTSPEGPPAGSTIGGEAQKEPRIEETAWNPYTSNVQNRYGADKGAILKRVASELELDISGKLPRDVHSMILESMKKQELEGAETEEEDQPFGEEQKQEDHPDPAEKEKQNDSVREPGDEQPDAPKLSKNEGQSGKLDYSDDSGLAIFAQIQVDDLEGLLKACEEVGYGKQDEPVIPLSQTARQMLHEKYLELKK